jgi:hypothetical protein
MRAPNSFRGSYLRVLAAILVLEVFLRCSGVVHAESSDDVEARVKAAFIYNFLRFVRWPQEAMGEPQSPVVIGVAGKDNLGSLLDETVQGKITGGHAIRIRRITSIEQAEHCQVLYVTDKKQMKALHEALASKPVLTIGDFDTAMRDGSVIGFRLIDESVRFEINVEAAERAGLTISSQLLKVAFKSPTGQTTSGK